MSIDSDMADFRGREPSSFAAKNDKQRTYGEKAVGLTFNPSGDAKVQKLKELYAQIIDICHDERLGAGSQDHFVLYSSAISEAQTAQMWAVKAVTWSD